MYTSTFELEYVLTNTVARLIRIIRYMGRERQIQTRQAIGNVDDHLNSLNQQLEAIGA